MTRHTTESQEPLPSPKPRLSVCPYCGAASGSTERCDRCRGPFDPLSRQATQNAMGPWFIRDEKNPFRPGCSYQTLVDMIERGKVTAGTVIRGPSSLQFWTVARRCPGVAHRLGVCHNCQRPVGASDAECPSCGAGFRVDSSRQHLGLGEVRYVPGRAAPVARRESGAASATAAAAATEPETIDATDGVLPSRPQDDASDRLVRSLKRSRRWQALWLICVIVLLVVVGAILLLPQLDLEGGPFGRWLGGESGAPGEVLPPDLSPGGNRSIVPTPPPTREESGPTPDSPAGPEGAPGTTEELEAPDDGGASAVDSMDDTQAKVTPPEALRDALQRLQRLR